MAGYLGLSATRAGYSWRLWVGDLVPTALAAGWSGVSGLGGWVQAAGQIGTGGASGVVAHKN